MPTVQPSLRQTLLQALAGPTTLLLLAAGTIVYGTAKSVVGSAYDQNLLNLAHGVASHVHATPGGLELQLPPAAELTARMRAVQRRGNGTASTPLAFGALVLDAEGRLAELDGDALTLTGREWDILEALVLADGRTVARERLQGDASSNALEVYVSRLRPRLESAGVLIRTVRGFGYRLEQLK